jgi:hypothetical protein
VPISVDVSTEEGSHARVRTRWVVDNLARTLRGPQRPLDALRDVRHAQEGLAEIRDLLTCAARRDGATWAQIGHALGVSRQAVHQADQRRRRHELERQDASMWRMPMPKRRHRFRWWLRRSA